MRRKDREVTGFSEIMKIVEQCEIVHLGLSDGDYPYIVPMNFAYEVRESSFICMSVGQWQAKDTSCSHKIRYAALKWTSRFIWTALRK